MGCADATSFEKKYDSLCVALRDSLNKSEVLSSNREIVRIVRNFEPETDSIVLFFNSEQTFTFASVYGRYNAFYGLESNYKLDGLINKIENTPEEDKKIDELVNYINGGGSKEKMSLLQQVQEMQRSSKIIVLRKQSPFPEPKAPRRPPMAYFGGLHPSTTIFYGRDDHTNFYQLYKRFNRAK